MKFSSIVELNYFRFRKMDGRHIGGFDFSRMHFASDWQIS